MMRGTPGTYRGWQVWQLGNPSLQLQIAPQLGGRILQCELGGHAFFFNHPALLGQVPGPSGLDPNGGWLNFGGEKLWPAPQGWGSPDLWPGPPDPVLDGGSYQVSAATGDDAAPRLRLTSPSDPFTGLEISRDIHVASESATVTIDARFRNIGTAPKRWSIWPVCQLIAAAGTPPCHQVVCPVNPQSRFERGYRVLYGDADDPQFRVTDAGHFIVDYRYRVAKVGLDSAAGWAASVDRANGKVFVLRFPPPGDHTYPDDTTVQVWTQGAGTIFSHNTVRKFVDDPVRNPAYLEMELLSPLGVIPPGESVGYTYRMQATTIARGESVVRIDDAAAIARPLTLTPHQEILRAQASYGVFQPGILRVSVEAGSGPVRCLHEQPATPLSETSFRVALPRPRPGTSIRIITSLHDREHRLLGEIESKRFAETSP